MFLDDILSTLRPYAGDSNSPKEGCHARKQKRGVTQESVRILSDTPLLDNGDPDLNVGPDRIQTVAFLVSTVILIDAWPSCDEMYCTIGSDLETSS